MPPPVDQIIDEILTAVQAREPACGAVRVIAIDGPSGSGKTWFSSLLADRVPGASTMHLEDFYRGWPGLESAPPAAEQILSALAVDQIGHATTWDWHHNTLGSDLVIAPSDLLIVEGVGAGSSRLRPFTNLLVWLDADEPTRKQHALARDGELYAPWWDVWAKQERSHFAREGTAAHAEVHLNLS